MAIWKNILQRFNLSQKDPNSGVLSPKVHEKSVMHRINRMYPYRVKAEMDKWRQAITAAESVTRPDRRLLYALYKEVVLDAHLKTQLRIAHVTVQRAPFKVLRRNKESDDMKALLDKKWFRDFLRHTLDAEFYGHSLMEFEFWNRTPDGQFKTITLVPREHVRPEYGDILLQAGAVDSLPYRNEKAFSHLLEVGDNYDLGILQIVSRNIIWKNYSLADWSLRNEKFGMPFLTVNTASRQKNELDAKEEMARNFGANGWAIMDDQDEIKFVESQSGNGAHKTYEDNARYQDEQISKAINGQTGASDDKSYVGAAEVHERLLNDFTFARLQSLEDYINDTLLPFLIAFGYPMQKCRFAFSELEDWRNKKKEESKTTSSAAKDRKGEPAPSDEPDDEGEKKKLIREVDALYTLANKHTCCDRPPAPVQLSSIDLDSLLEKAVRNIYEKRVKAGDLDPDTWRHNVERLTKGLDEGFGRSTIAIEYDDPQYELSQHLRYNAMVFSAFKNHNEVSDMVAELTDATGKLVPWEQFRTKALAITGQYNKQWLEAEYNSAVAAGQMSVKWKDFKDQGAKYLRYTTIRDDRVRPAHQLLHGTTLPIEDPFWSKYFPPNGWNCRCDVQAISGDVKKVQPKGMPTDKEVPPTFRHNPGLTQEIFSKDHPYFKNFSKEDKKRVLNNLRNVMADADMYELVADPNNPDIMMPVHVTHDREERAENLRMAFWLKEKKMEGKLLGVGNVPGKTYPDFKTDAGLIIEFESPTVGTVNAIDRAIREAHRQGADIGFIEIPQDTSAVNIANGISNRFRRTKLSGIWIKWGDALYQFDKADVLSGKFIRGLYKKK